MIHADGRLALRLEELVCREFRRLAQVARSELPGSEAVCETVVDGVALWLGDGSPVNIAAGLAMSGPVTEADLRLLESFYHERGATAAISVCPLADRSLLRLLGERGWQAADYEHVLVLDLEAPRPRHLPADDANEVEVRVCRPEERAAWTATVARGFSEAATPERGHEEFGTVMAAREEAILVLAWVDGAPAGTGTLVVDGGVGWLSGDSTLPPYRRRGIQQAIQRYRLDLAREAGCEMAVTEAVPGGASQRNMERSGFRIAYTHVEFFKEAAHGS